MYMVNRRSDTRLGDSDLPMSSPRDWSLSLSLLAERRCFVPSCALGVGPSDASGPVTETIGMGVSRLATEADCSLPMMGYALTEVSLMFVSY